MSMQRIGNELSAREFWQSHAGNYAAAIDSTYHRHRLDVIRALLPDLRGKRVVDFGCGEGVLIRMAREMGAAKVIGIEPDEELARKAGQDVLIGSVEQFLHADDAHCVIAANVIGYLNEEQEAIFYRQARRIMPHGGHLVVMHSNQFFDFFALNAHTVDSFRDVFDCDVTELLTHWETRSPKTYNIRENPETYGEKLRKYGFKLERMEFANFHEVPPLLDPSRDAEKLTREYRDTLTFPKDEWWKLKFQCSMFGVRAGRV